MPYPVIDVRTSRKIRDELLGSVASGMTVSELQASASTDLDGRARERQDFDVSLDGISKASSDAQARWFTTHPEGGEPPRSAALYELEAEMAGTVHSCLRDLPVGVLADPDFWRYLALGPFRWYLLVREPELQDQDFGGVDRNRKYWLLVRTYLWGQLAYDQTADDSYERTTIVGEVSQDKLGKTGMVIDFWHSHLIRRYFAVTSTVSLAFIDEATSDPLCLDESTKLEDRHANAFARRMTRVRRLVDLALVGDATSRDLVHEQKMRTLGLWDPPHGGPA